MTCRQVAINVPLTCYIHLSLLPWAGELTPCPLLPLGWGQLNSCCWLQLGEGLFPGWH